MDWMESVLHEIEQINVKITSGTHISVSLLALDSKHFLIRKLTR